MFQGQKALIWCKKRDQEAHVVLKAFNNQQEKNWARILVEMAISTYSKPTIYRITCREYRPCSMIAKTTWRETMRNRYSKLEIGHQRDGGRSKDLFVSSGSANSKQNYRWTLVAWDLCAITARGGGGGRYFNWESLNYVGLQVAPLINRFQN